MNRKKTDVRDSSKSTTRSFVREQNDRLFTILTIGPIVWLLLYWYLIIPLLGNLVPTAITVGFMLSGIVGLGIGVVVLLKFKGLSKIASVTGFMLALAGFYFYYFQTNFNFTL